MSLKINQKSGFGLVIISIIATFGISLTFGLIRMIELIYGVENPNRYNVFQYWFSLFIMDFMILIISTLFLFLLVKRIFFSNIEEKINKINKCLRLMIILGFILILPYLFIDIEYTTPIGLTLIFLFKIGFLLFIIGLGLLMVDIMDRRKKENLK